MNYKIRKYANHQYIKTMNNKNKRKAMFGTIMATGIAASVACNAQTAAAEPEQSQNSTSAEKIIVDGQELSVDRIIQEIGNNLDTMAFKGSDDRRIVTKYGGPPSFNQITPILSQEEIEFGIREIIAEHLEIDIDSVTAGTPIDLANQDSQWQDIVVAIALKYHVHFNDVYPPLSQLENPVVEDLMTIVSKEYMKKQRLL